MTRAMVFSRVLLLLSIAAGLARTAAAQSAQPWSGRGARPSRPAAAGTQSSPAQAVAMVGLTVSDMDRSVTFYTEVLDFRQVSDDELAGDAYEQLTGVFGSRVRVARLRLGNEYLQLTEFLAPRGRPAPADSRSNDHWFQHVAIIVRDMDSAYARLRRFRVQHASTGPQLLPPTIPAAAGIRAFYFRDPDGHPLELLQFPPRQGRRPVASPDGPALSRHRPHRDRRDRHPGEPRVLPRRARLPGGG